MGAEEGRSAAAAVVEATDASVRCSDGVPRLIPVEQGALRQYMASVAQLDQGLGRGSSEADGSPSPAAAEGGVVTFGVAPGSVFLPILSPVAANGVHVMAQLKRREDGRHRHPASAPSALNKVAATFI